MVNWLNDHCMLLPAVVIANGLEDHRGPAEVALVLGAS